MPLRTQGEQEGPAKTSSKNAWPAALGPPSEPDSAMARPPFVEHSNRAKGVIGSDANRELAEAGQSFCVTDSEQTPDFSVRVTGSDVSKHFSDSRTVQKAIRAEPLVSEDDVQVACTQNRSTTKMVLAEAESPVDAVSCRDKAADWKVGSRSVSEADTAAAGTAAPLVSPQLAAEVRDGCCSTGLTVKTEGGDSTSMYSCDFSNIQCHCLPFIRLLQELLDIVGLVPGDGSDVKPKKQQNAMDEGFKKQCGEAVPVQADVVARLVPVLLEVGHCREKLLKLLFSPSQRSEVGCATKPPLPNLRDRPRTVGSCDFQPIRQIAASKVAAAAVGHLSGHLRRSRSTPATISTREEMAAGNHEVPDALALASDTVSRPQEEEEEQPQKAELPSDGAFANNYTPTDTVATAESRCAVSSPSTATRRRASSNVLSHDAPIVLRPEMAVDCNMVVDCNGIIDPSVFDGTECSQPAIPKSSSLKASSSANKSLPLILKGHGCSPNVVPATLHHHATSSCADTKTAATDNMAASDDTSVASLRNNTNADVPDVSRLTCEPKIAYKASTAADDAARGSDHIAPEAVRTLTRPFNAAACTPSIGPLGRGRGHRPGHSDVPLETSFGRSPAAGRGRSTTPRYSPPNISRLSSSSSGIVTASPTDADGDTCSSERFSDSAQKDPGDAVDEKTVSRQENASVDSDPGRVAAASSMTGHAEQCPSLTSPINMQAVSTAPSSFAASGRQILATDPGSCRLLQEIWWPSSVGDSKFGLTLTLLRTELFDVKCFDVAVTPNGIVVMAAERGLYLCQVGCAGHPELLHVGSNQCYQCVAAVPDGADAHVGGSAQSGRTTMLVAGNKTSRYLELLALSGSWPDVVCKVVRVLLKDNLPWCVAVDREGRTAAVSSARFVYTAPLDGSNKHGQLCIGYTVSALAYSSQALIVGSKEKQGGQYALEARDASSVDRPLWKLWLKEAVSCLLCDLDSHCYVLPARSHELRIISAADGVPLTEVTLHGGRLPPTAIGANYKWLVFLLVDRTLAQFEKRFVQWRAAKF